MFSPLSLYNPVRHDGEQRLKLIRHFARLPTGMVLLWLFLIWYLVMVWLHFEPDARLWLNSLGMALFVGSALMLSTAAGRPGGFEFWRVLRLYLIPFCVSSFSALVRDSDFYTLFAPSVRENLIAAAGCTVFVCWVGFCRGIEALRGPDEA